MMTIRWTISRQLWALVLVTIIVRVPWLMLQPTDLAHIRQQLPDQAEYLEIANNLRAEQSLHFHDPRFTGEVYAFRMPGYPVLIALLGGQPTLVRIAQVLLDASTVVAAYFITRRWMVRSRWIDREAADQSFTAYNRLQESKADSPRCGHWIGLPFLAGLLVALNPWMIYFSSLLLSETLFTAMLAWGLVLFGLPVERRWGLIGGMLLTALSIYVRPSALLLPVVLTIFSIWANHRDRSPYNSSNSRWLVVRSSVVWATGSLIVTMLVLLPWGWRNHQHPAVQHWIWTTTNSGFTAYDGYQPAATGASDQRFTISMPQLQTMNEVQRSEYLNKLAWQAALDDPGRSLELMLLRVIRTWSPLPLSQQYSRLVYILPAVFYSIPFFLLVLLGLWRGEMAKMAKLFLLAPVFYFTLIHGLTVGSARYRIPVEAPLAVLAAAGLTSAWVMMQHRRRASE